MDRALISQALGEIRAEHVTAALVHRPARAGIRKKAVLALLAAAALLALAATAYALGAFGSLFAEVPEILPVPDPARYEIAGALSDKEPKAVPLEDLPGHTFTLTESYYDGQELLLAYSLDSMKYPVLFGFGPGDDGFEELIPIGRWYIDSQWQEQVTPEEYRRMETLFRQEDSVGFVIRSAYLGDHIRLSDGTDLGPMVQTEVDGNTILECQNGLPEAARDREELELVITVREILNYYYKENETLYQATRLLQETTAEISVPNTGK